MDLKINDRIYFNQGFWTNNTLAVPGREALHIFDLKQMKCVDSRRDLGYSKIVNSL